MYVQNVQYQHLATRDRRVKLDLFLFTNHVAYGILLVR